MKSLEDIRSEFFDQLKQKDSELLVEVHRARDEKDALLQRAGIDAGRRRGPARHAGNRL